MGKARPARNVAVAAAHRRYFTAVFHTGVGKEKLDGMVLVDGGLLNNMPADVCREMGADVVVSVDLNHTRGSGTSSDKLLDTIVAVWDITAKGTVLKGQLNSDVIITPELADYKNTKLEGIEEMAEEGYRAAMEKMPQIQQLLNTKF